MKINYKLSSPIEVSKLIYAIYYKNLKSYLLLRLQCLGFNFKRFNQRM